MSGFRSQPRFRLSTRAAGLLLHPTSLPGPHGIGDLGPAVHRFIDFLHAAGQTWWQMLPIGPAGPGNAPYSALSAFAGNPLLISLEHLADDGLLARTDLKAPSYFPCDRVAYPAVSRFKLPRLRRAFENFRGAGGLTQPAFQRFCDAHAAWLDDYALFQALRHTHRNRIWTRWPHDLRHRRRSALRAAAAALAAEMAFERFVQYQFDRQWEALRRYAHAQGVGLIGDIPIFVAHDSSDVWAHRELFDLDPTGHPRTVSGVPPDYFSSSGQRWGHPHYRWAVHRASGFAWWLDRFWRAFAQFDAVRIDHFLGFNRVWAVPGRAKTARSGKWVKTPGAALFSTLRRRLGRLEIIAEDLGRVVPEAVALRDRFGLPGMRILQFAFRDDAGSRYNQPHTYPRNCVVYPGTHDNETVVGWFARTKRAARGRRTEPGRPRSDLRGAVERGRPALTPYGRLLRYLGSDGRDIHWDIIRLALLSPANLAIISVQDLLGLGNEARMNTPATARGNWEWRLHSGQLVPAIAQRLRDLTQAYGRA